MFDKKRVGFWAIMIVILGIVSIGVYKAGSTLRKDAGDYIVYLQDKRQLLHQMMASAKERSLLLLRLYSEKDPFKQDDLSLEMNLQARMFNAATTDFKKRTSSKREREIMDEINVLVSQNTPLQNKAKDLLMFWEDKAQAAELLFGHAIPRQINIISKIESLMEILDQESQSKIESLDIMSSDLNTHITMFLVFFLGTAFLFAKRNEYRLENLVNEKTEKLKNTLNELKKASETDSLTGVANRRAYDDIVRKQVLFSRRSGAALSLVLIDVDCFKLYNDNYGHSKGDDVLKAVASALHNSLPRSTDVVARYGGEEFAIILPVTDMNGAKKVAEIILTNVNNLKIPHEHSTAENHVTVSIGIATMYGDDISEDDLFRLADKALYFSKDNGRNQFYGHEFNPPLPMLQVVK